MNLEGFRRDLISLKLGPNYGPFQEPFLSHLELDGDRIAACRIESGFLYRGVEKGFEMTDWNSVISFADRVDPECAAFYELALCLSIEDITKTVVPRRAQFIRIIVCELTRVSNHLKTIARLAEALEAPAVIHYLMREREKVLDLFELLTGARFSFHFLRIGGVAFDVSDGFIERLIDVCGAIEQRQQEYLPILAENRNFQKRCVGSAVVSKEVLEKIGVTGPNLRAAGSSFDLRIHEPKHGYEFLKLAPLLGSSELGALGDTYNRFLIRFREISQSLKLILQVIEILPKETLDETLSKTELKVTSGEAYSQVEGSRGMLGCYVNSNGSSNPVRVQFRSPTQNNIQLLEIAARETPLGDFPLLVNSLDLCFAENDR